MGRLHFRWPGYAVLASSLCFLGGCGGNKPPGPSPFPARITLSPATSVSLQLGTTANFSASAQNASGSTVSAAFTFQSSDTAILNIAPNGVACAGRWDTAFTTCTPQGSGVVQVTASALGVTSAPTLVFVHPPIDNIQVDKVDPVNPPPPACPGQQIIPAACVVPFTANSACLSTNQVKTLEAKAFSNGVDITASVGPVTWSETSPSVVKVTPVTSSSSNTPTNQVTVTPNTPGFTPIFASVSGISSQPYYAETCPVQCIALELGHIDSGQTSFTVNKGTAQTVIATAVDVQGCVVPKPPLTWSSSQPASVAAGSSTSGCAAGTTCSVSTAQPGAGSVTASCTPPTCNIGFPQSVAGLPQSLVQPLPVYPVTPISALVNGTTSPTTVLATSLGCFDDNFCGVAAYNVSTSTNLAGNPIGFPTPPNSILFDLAGDKAYMGSQFGAQAIAPGNLGTANNAFTPLGTVTGKILAVSPNGSAAIFSDIVHTPNQVYVVNTAGASSNTTALNISGATAAAFSPDGLKAFIIGCKSGQCLNGGDTLYVYSALQQTIPLATASATDVAFSSNGAFAFVSGGASSPAVTVYNVCNNSLALTIPMSGATAAPNFLKVLPDGVHLVGLDSTGFDYITTSVAGPPFPALCPQSISGSSQHIGLGQGTFTPIDFFVSPDGTRVYVVASDRSSILVYDFNTGSVSGSIPLAGNAAPVSASMTVDGTLIYVAGSDGTLHELSPVSQTDLLQISFPNLNSHPNPFCTLDPTRGAQQVPCKLDFVDVKP